jgi:hypothetical protein
MTDAEIEAAAEAYVRRSCAEQGVPEFVTDPSTISRVIALLGNGSSAGRGSDATNAAQPAGFPLSAPLATRPT